MAKEHIIETEPKQDNREITTKVTFSEDYLEKLRRIAVARGTDMTGAIMGAIDTEIYLRDKYAAGIRLWESFGNNASYLRGLKLRGK